MSIDDVIRIAFAVVVSGFGFFLWVVGLGFLCMFFSKGKK